LAVVVRAPSSGARLAHRHLLFVANVRRRTAQRASATVYDESRLSACVARCSSAHSHPPAETSARVRSARLSQSCPSETQPWVQHRTDVRPCVVLRCTNRHPL